MHKTHLLSRQRGSSLLLALMVLAILTVIGLSLVLVTETEMILGSTERVLGETTEVSESALSAAIAQLAITNSFDSRTLFMSSSWDENPVEEQSAGGGSGTAGSTHLGYEMRNAGFYPVLYDELPYSSEGEGSRKFYGAYITGAFRTMRLGWPGDELVPPEGCDDVTLLATSQYQMVGFFFGPTNQPPAVDAANASKQGRDASTVDFRGSGAGGNCGDELADAVDAGSTWGTSIAVTDLGQGSHVTSAAIEATSGFFR
ncbi:MAG: pilus assembly PilX N-terminal domain-containing protein [Acidobacteriota bacterium]